MSKSYFGELPIASVSPRPMLPDMKKPQREKPDSCAGGASPSAISEFAMAPSEIAPVGVVSVRPLKLKVGPVTPARRLLMRTLTLENCASAASWPVLVCVCATSGNISSIATPTWLADAPASASHWSSRSCSSGVDGVLPDNSAQALSSATATAAWSVVRLGIELSVVLWLKPMLDAVYCAKPAKLTVTSTGP